jgi:hypothetical protein
MKGTQIMQPSLEERIQEHLHKLSEHFGRKVIAVEESIRIPITDATATLHYDGDYGYVVKSDPNTVTFEVYFSKQDYIDFERTSENDTLYANTVSLINEVKRRVGE